MNSINRCGQWLVCLTAVILLMSSLGAFASGPGGVSSGLFQWLKADTLTLSNGSEVLSWPDQGTMGNNLVSASGLGPTFVTDAINGLLPVVRFGLNTGDHPKTYMWREIAGDEAATGTTFIVYNKRPGNEEWESLPIDFGGFTGYDRLNGTADVYGLHPSVVLYGNIPIAGVDYSVQTFNFNGASSWVKLDGANTTALANMTGVTFSGWELIGTKQDAWGYANIDVAEVIRYNRVLTSEEENAVGAYLETKYLLSTAYVTGPNGVNGVVVDEGSNPVPGAIVRVVDGTEAAKTDSAGAFTMAINPGTYTLRVTKSGYGTGELTNVVVQANTYTPVSLLLPAPPPPTGVSGIVSASNLPGNPPIVGARVRALGTSYQTYTGSNGGYTLELPTGTYEIEADKDHYGSSAAEFNAVEGTIQSLNFSMTHDGIWDLVTDYTTVCNPAGQWSFGYTETETGPLTPLATRINNAWSAGMNLWMDASADGWYGFIGRNDTGAPVTVDQYAAESCISYVEPGDMYFGGGGHPGNQVRIRWTAPDQRIVKINLRYFSQFNDQNNQGANLSLTVAKNGDAISVRSVSGFMGRADAGYTDRVGTAPENTFETMLIANSGDTIDFVVGQGGLYGDSYTWKWPHKSVAIWATVTTSTEGSVVGTVAQIKNAPVGTTVFLTTPVRLASSTGGDFAFTRKYGGASERYFYLQDEDRIHGIRCYGDASMPTYAKGYKITLSGVVESDAIGQKVVRVFSINSATADTDAKPLGKGAKALSNTGTLVRVWGKITSMVPVASPQIDPESGLAMWQYEYIMINDGAQDIKIPMNIQYNWMSKIDGMINSLTTGSYIGVTGIATTTNGSDVVVCPRNVADFNIYYDPNNPGM